ncbi:hypothetical protein E3P92_01918 [Wallemia ichthyophaga]|uniref:Inositol-pentakisphosphate 2-kinase n=2 Tax=Wallemia ichthyophaga TaxID=245174 RepID=A0A4T0HER0_WALIC|nr:hypothetical protein E3P91_01771 [Wallemia ichthyophaga]TIA82061.1 hypothetical protein E3P98_01685 [Wallemia ichthyophaga]TIB00436.1 hypothetical protein E3P95_01700 [Wallemia ichthyophaga]TIB01627.1 hypothetical protein E3P94_01735 [Wallemia ichthyophaga]TIB13007.1 hypothetical protein E3P90_01824 [Wallemia ichthyophaga]
MMSVFSKGAGNVLFKMDSDMLLRVRMDKDGEGCIDSEEEYDDVIRKILPWLNPAQFLSVDNDQLKALDPDNAYHLTTSAQVTENLIKEYDLVVEIKPKWASLPNPLSVGLRHSRMKLKCSFQSERLFSESRQEQLEELSGLIDGDSKFLTVFSKGRKVRMDSETIAGRLQEALNDSGVMRAIKYYQLYSDPLDIQHIYPLVKDTNTCNPSTSFLRGVINKIPKHPGLPTWGDLKAFGGSLSGEELLYLYSLSMTLRDVSVLVRLSPETQPKVKVVDADYKCLSRIHKWYESDCKLNNFHATG